MKEHDGSRDRGSQLIVEGPCLTVAVVQIFID